MWCEKCHYGNQDYSFNHCGHCGGTKMLTKNPFIKKKEKGKKKEEVSPKKNTSSTREDVEAITSGKMKPTVMR